MASVLDPTSAIFNLPLNDAQLPQTLLNKALSNSSNTGAMNSAVESNTRLHEDKYVERDGKHKGVAGTARDILGFLGDLLLTRLHMPAMYAQSQERRKLAAAQEGFDQDPESAINRVASIDPAMGIKMREQHTDNQRVAAQNAATNEARDARIALAKEEQNQKTRLYTASMLGTMATWPEEKRKAYYPTLRNQVLNAGKRRGVDLSEELPEEYDPVQLDAFIDGAVPVGTQRSQRLSQGRLSETVRHNKTNEELTGDRINETIRHNQSTEGISTGRLGETIRHNTTTEEQGDRRLDGSAEGRTERERHNRVTESNAAPVVRTQVINGVKYKFKLVGKDWVNLGRAP